MLAKASNIGKEASKINKEEPMEPIQIESKEEMVNEDGTLKTVTEMLVDKNGKRWKRIRTFKITRIRERISRAVLERKGWKPFGKEKDKRSEPSGRDPFDIHLTLTLPAQNGAPKVDEDMETKIIEKPVVAPSTTKFAVNRTSVRMLEEEKNHDIHQVFISNLPPETTYRDIQTLLRGLNHIKIKNLMDQQTQTCKGICFVHFQTKEQAQNCIQRIHGRKYGTCILFATFAEPQVKKSEDIYVVGSKPLRYNDYYPKNSGKGWKTNG
jgi:hypothetical protein